MSAEDYLPIEFADDDDFLDSMAASARWAKVERMAKKKRRKCPDHGIKLVSAMTRYGLRLSCPIAGCTVASWLGQTSTPADAMTRQARMQCHQLFDVIWQHKANGSKTTNKVRKRRDAAYRWLAARMDLPTAKTHFGMFNFDQCLQAIALLESRRMLYFVDGPAKGRSLAATRTPFLLRVSVTKDDTGVECNCLEQLHQRPGPGDKAYCYILVRRQDEPGQVSALYRLFEYQPEQAVFWDGKGKWAKWCMDMANGPALPLADAANVELDKTNQAK